MKKIVYIIFTICFGFLSCDRRPYIAPTTDVPSSSNQTLYIQPMGNIDNRLVLLIDSVAHLFYGYNCVILPEISPTEEMLAPSKTKLDAHSVLTQFYSKGHIQVITNLEMGKYANKDYPEWDVWGQGQQNGDASVVSTYQLQSKNFDILSNRVIVVSLHELGHNVGLDHCPDKNCIMYSGESGLSYLDNIPSIRLCEQCRQRYLSH